MSTLNNLKEAFAGESQANRKYLAFAKKADEEGFHQVARLFRAAAAAETVHAHNHLTVMNGIGNTEENLKEAINGETEEFTEMYPSFIEEAKEAGEGPATTSVISVETPWKRKPLISVRFVELLRRNLY